METLCEILRPKSIGEVVMNREVGDWANACITNNGMSENVLLHGPPGTGKTSICEVLANSIADTQMLVLNCSQEGGIDQIRNKVSNFVTTGNPFGDGPKICVLSEADGLSSSAQKALKDLMEIGLPYGVYFALTSNNPLQIIEPLRSRCRILEVKPSVDAYREYLADVVKTLELDVDIDTLARKYYPDFRAALNNAEGIEYDGGDDFVELADAIFALLSAETVDEVALRKLWLQDHPVPVTEFVNLAEHLIDQVIDKNGDMMFAIRLIKQMDDFLDVAHVRQNQEVAFYAKMLKVLP